jgi:surface antigen
MESPMKRLLCVALIALSVSGCALRDRDNKLATAAITGALVGGFIGWEVFGPGTSGMLGATFVGAGGAGAAYLATNYVLIREQEALHHTTYDALESVPPGQTARWKSADSEMSASITPLHTFFDKDGRPCREFVIVYQIGQSQETMRRTACRTINGAWQTI